MRSELPLEVLSLMGPLLCWVESPEGLALPDAWLTSSTSFERRQQAWLLRELPNYSYDTVDEILDLSTPTARQRRPPPLRPWQGGFRLEPPRGYDLNDALDQLTERYFVWNEGSVAVREGRMEEVHLLSLRFPVGHLIRHFHARAANLGWVSGDRILEQPAVLNLLPSNSYGLRTVVRRGLSEGHLHLHGVSSAEEAWADALVAEVSPNALRGFSPTETRLLLLGRYAGRLLALTVLAIELADRCPPPGRSLLRLLDAIYFTDSSYRDRHARALLHHHLSIAASRLMADAGTDSRLSQWDGDGLEWLLYLVRRTQWWLQKSPRAAVDTPSTSLARHRLLDRLHLHAHLLLTRLDRRHPGRKLLHQVLYRYLVFRTHHWQMATQTGKTTGLRYFKNFYDSHLRQPLLRDDDETKKIIIDKLQRWRGLRVVEGRVTPPRNGARDLVPWILGYAEGVRRERVKKLGLIIHFIKAEKQEVASECPHNGLPTLRLGGIRRRSRSQAFRLFRLLSGAGPWVPFVVGIDAANLELTTPPEIFAPTFRFLRELPIEPRAPIDPNADRFHILPQVRELAARRRLGMTYHVGEDFRHLLSGLRAIWEAAEFLSARPGDRLGHATALGLEPDVWAQQTGYQAVVPRLEWLDTLVWVTLMLGVGHPLVIRLRLEDIVQRLAWKVFVPAAGGGELDGAPPRVASDLSLLTLHDAWALRQLDPYCVELEELEKGYLRFRPGWSPSSEAWRWCHIQRRIQKRLQKSTGSPNAYRLLSRYWYDFGVRRRGDESELVDMQADWAAWRDLCAEVQSRALGEVRRRQLVIEVNPSVNRAIGPMSVLAQHPIFRLSLDEGHRLKRDVPITVNTDNPAVFNTSLAHEFYLLGEVLMREGRPEAEVVEWLDWLRENGKSYSFVHQLPAADDANMKDVLDAVQRARPSVATIRGRRPKLTLFWRDHERLVKAPGSGARDPKTAADSWRG